MGKSKWRKKNIYIYTNILYAIFCTLFLHVFFLPPLSFSLSLSCFLFLSLFLSLSLFISAPSFSLWLQDTCHLTPFTKYSLLDQSYFFTPYLSIAHIKFTNYSPTIFYDYHPQSCLKNIFFALGPTVVYTKNPSQALSGKTLSTLHSLRATVCRSLELEEIWRSSECLPKQDAEMEQAHVSQRTPVAPAHK